MKTVRKKIWVRDNKSSVTLLCCYMKSKKLDVLYYIQGHNHSANLKLDVHVIDCVSIICASQMSFTIFTVHHYWYFDDRSCFVLCLVIKYIFYFQSYILCDKAYMYLNYENVRSLI